MSYWTLGKEGTLILSYRLGVFLITNRSHLSLENTYRSASIKPNILAVITTTVVVKAVNLSKVVCPFLCGTAQLE